MARYFFNIVRSDDVAADLEGMELPDLDAVREEAIASVRELVAEIVRSGGKIDGRQIQVCDKRGNTVLNLVFRDVVS